MAACVDEDLDGSLGPLSMFERARTFVLVDPRRSARGRWT